ncbi:MAG TPA: hypothetical protein VGH94_07350, partial [Acidimicrobiales bacterium]
MPDLSHRPTRYALALTSLVSLAAIGTAHYDVRFGVDPTVASAESQNVDLQGKVDQLERKLHQTQAQLDAAKATNAKATQDATAVAHALATGQLVVASGSRASCASYADQESAERAFLVDRVGLAALDGDHDGRACEQLKSSAPPQVVKVLEPAAPPQEPSPPAPPARPTAPSKAELLASGHHFGLMDATLEDYDAVEASLAWDTTIHGYFAGWDIPFDADRISSTWGRGEIPMVTWESRPLADTETTPQSDYSLENIIGGNFDAYLTTYAQQVKALGLPMIIRFDQEMNGDWYRWSEVGAPVGNQPGDYI